MKINYGQAIRIAAVFAIHAIAFSQTIEKTILDDPLNSSTFNATANPGVSRSVEGGSFSGAGWKPVGSTDLIVYDLGRYLEKGSLEIDVSQFEPAEQNSEDRHHVLAMFRTPWGGHHVVENLETLWDFHTGSNFFYGNGIKLLSSTYDYEDEAQSYLTNEDSNWDKNQTYRIKIIWNGSSIKYFRDNFAGPALLEHELANEMQLRYLYVGRDRTVSGDLVTNFLGNQYPAMKDADGPIYSNLLVKEIVSAADETPPVITVVIDDEEYANGAKVVWDANEPGVVFHVEYGTNPGNYSFRTPVLDPPTTTIWEERSTLLPNLNPNTTYYFRVVGRDNAGNVGFSQEHIFTTLSGGEYIFQPVADTYIERNNSDAGYGHLYGPTRAHGNYGWMNLMAANGVVSYLQFDVSGLNGNIGQATLRLHGRGDGYTPESSPGASGVVIKQFTPVQPNWESNVTWNNRTGYIGSMSTEINRINKFTAGQWHSVDVSHATPVQNGSTHTYYLALEGFDANYYAYDGKKPFSLDSRESTNNQPELIIEVGPKPDFTDRTILFPARKGDVAWGDYDADGDLDILIIGDPDGMNLAGMAKVLRNDNGSFVDILAPLAPVRSGAIAWGDYNGDNFLDILLTGVSDAGPSVTKVYKYEDGNFTEIETVFPGMSHGAVAWGNFNNDRYLDILISGLINGVGTTQVYRGKANATWAAHSASLPGLFNGSAAWGFNNFDDFVDILLAGEQANGQAVVKIFRNKENTNGSRSFVEVATDIPTLSSSSGDRISCVWGNYDDDWDLDIAYAGYGSTKVFERTSNHTYQDIDPSAFSGRNWGAAAWGNYDADGDLDLMVMGHSSLGSERTDLYHNDNPSPGGFSLAYGSEFNTLERNRYGSTAFGDFDADGDLDLLYTGESGTKLYVNNLNPANAPPSVPTGLTHNPEGSDGVVLSWNESSDDQTSQAAIIYNLMVGTAQNGVNIISPMSVTATGRRMIPTSGNAGTNNYWTLQSLSPGTYYWKVQAVDNCFQASAFSTSASFTISSSAIASLPDDETVSNEPSEISEAQVTTSISQNLPEKFMFHPNYPNPFNSSTRFQVDLPEDGRMLAIVYNLQGQEIMRLRDADLKAGYHTLYWDGRTSAGEIIGSGPYIANVVIDGISGRRWQASQRVVLLK